MTNYTWTGATGDNLWSTPANWSPFSLTGGPNGPPGSGDAAFLGSLGESVVVGSGVNAAADALFMGDIFDPAAGVTNAPILTVDNGRTFTIDGAGSILADGAIDVQTGATMVWDFSGTFIDGATIVIGKILSGNGGQIEPSSNLEIDGTVTLDDGGVAPATLYLGDSEFQNTSAGSITNSGVTSDTLVNVSDIISGAGSISVTDFDNQVGGTVEASQGRGGFALQISSPTFTNEGQMVAETTSTLAFGADGTSGSLVNSGTIQLEEDADLAISGSFTISGKGSVDAFSEVDGADISSDQHGPATFTNESTIAYGGSGQIGDQGLNGGRAPNDLTFDNDDGTVEELDGVLTLNTGSNTITDNGGGILFAEFSGEIFIDSPVITGGQEFVFDGHEFGGGGTIEAINGGLVTISAAVTPGSGPTPYGDGQILIDDGIVVMAAGATDTTPINFSGFAGTLQLDSASNTIGTIGGMSEDDVIDLRYQSFAAGDEAVFNAGTLSLENAGGATIASFTLSGSYTSANFTVASDGSGGTKIEYLNQPPPAGTTADMIMEQSSTGTYEIYDLGNNAILAADPLGQIVPELQVAGLGDFDGTDTTDMLLRDSDNGGLHVYDISNNNITMDVFLGQVGLEWTVSGFADFSGNLGETDMLMQNSNTGVFELFDISNNAITFASGMGQVGLAWTVAGFGDFSGRAGETGDMLMRNASTGQFEVYDISNNAITFATGMGQVGLEWSVAGFGDFSGNANETDMLMRNSNTGAFELYDISNNAITFAGPMGQVGLEWSVVGFGPIDGTGSSDMLMRNTNTGAFEIFDIGNNQLTNAAAMGQVGNEWSVAGIAADPPSSASAQLVQAMATYAPASGAPAISSPINQTTIVPSITNNLMAAHA